MTDETKELETNAEVANPLEPFVMRISHNYYDGDPASPEPTTVEFWNGDRCIAEMIFHDEDNEDLEEAIINLLKTNGGKVEHSSNVDNTYYG